MFADVKRLPPFGLKDILPLDQESKLDYDFPKRAKLRELLQLDAEIKLESIDLLHKSHYEALFGIRLNFTNGISTELTKTSYFKHDQPKNYKIDTSKKIGKVGARIDDTTGLIYGIRFQEENGTNIVSINWVDQGSWVD